MTPRHALFVALYGSCVREDCYAARESQNGASIPMSRLCHLTYSFGDIPLDLCRIHDRP